MDEKLDRLEKNMNDLIEIVVSIKDYMMTRMATKDELAEGLASVREDLGSKIDGLQRGLDANFERVSSVGSRVSKIETHLNI